MLLEGRRVVHVVEGQGEAIVFVHGNASTHETWAGVTKPLSGHFRCVSYDLRGHGGRALGDSQLDLQDFVDDLESLRCELNLERAYYVGHSLGSFITAAYMAQYPERVRAGCLMAAPAGRNSATRQGANQFIEKLRANGVANAMSGLISLWYTDEFVAAHPDALRHRLQQIASHDEDVFIRTYELYNRIDIERWLDDIKAPTLVMTGEFAQGAGAAVARSIADTLTKSKVVIFEGLKNGILTEIPGRIAEELFAFFRQHRADR